MSYEKQGIDLEHDLRKLAKPNNWWPDPSSSPRVALDTALNIASKVLIQQYESKKKLPMFKHRNWFRDLDTLTDIRSGLEFPFAFGFPPRIGK